MDSRWEHHILICLQYYNIWTPDGNIIFSSVYSIISYGLQTGTSYFHLFTVLYHMDFRRENHILICLQYYNIWTPDGNIIFLSVYSIITRVVVEAGTSKTETEAWVAETKTETI